MKAIVLMPDLPNIDSVEQPMGGMERELISIGLILSEKYATIMYLNTTKNWIYNNVVFVQREQYSISESVNIAVNCDNPCKHRLEYCFRDCCIFGNNINLIITDTKRGVQKYEKDGHHAVLFYPPTPLGGFDTIRNKRKILFVGAINVGKRVDLAIESVNLLPMYELHIIGMQRGKAGEWCGRYVEDYRAYCEGISKDNIIWRGALSYSDVILEMQSAEMIIISYCSDEEFNTNVALEAISNGCVPLIAEGLVDYFHGDEGVLLPNQRDLNAEIIAKSIKLLDDDIISKHRQNCWRTAQEIWDYCNNEMKDAICGI